MMLKGKVIQADSNESAFQAAISGRQITVYGVFQDGKIYNIPFEAVLTIPSRGGTTAVPEVSDLLASAGLSDEVSLEVSL